MTQTLTLRRPDDWHLHLRDGAMLDAVLPYTAAHFARAIIMPNLVPPVVRGADAAAYRDRILAALPEGAEFKPLMTLYLTEDTDPDDVAAAHASGLITAVKLYPAGATTNSASGVSNFDNVAPVLERMAEIGLPLCTHGEVTDPEIDIFDREAVFIDRVLDPIRTRHAGLKVVMEHITTADAAQYVTESTGNLGATITTHHLVINRNHILAGGICALPRLRATRASFWARIPRRIRTRTSCCPAAVPAALPRPIRCRSWPRSLNRKTRWTNWNGLPR